MARWNRLRGGLSPFERGSRAERNLREVPDLVRCMFPAEGALTPDDTSRLEDGVMQCGDSLLGPGDSPGPSQLSRTATAAPARSGQV